METKKCKVIFTRGSNPIHNNCYGNIDIFDLHNNLIASTSPEKKYVRSIPYSFINDFVHKNGTIKEVLIEMEEVKHEAFVDIMGAPYMEPKLDSKGCIIIRLIDTMIDATKIPIGSINKIIMHLANWMPEKEFAKLASVINVQDWIEHLPVQQSYLD
jgi:hypothetical protein